jgi:N,N'-diacetyllegionaminate synthase
VKKSLSHLKRTELIGEIGLSHEGSLGVAMAMATSCKENGLDYVKFQFHNPDFESTRAENFRVRVFPQDETRFDYWRRTSFSLDAWKTLIEHCKNIDIKFLCTPFSVWAAKQLLVLGCKEIKIGSGDANNFELLEYARKNFQKIFISLGMSTSREVEATRKFFGEYEGELILMQCTSSYPSDLEDVGLSFLDLLRGEKNDVGLSDHTGNFLVPISAISAGACFVEFHVVYNKAQFGPDSKSSLTFEESRTVAEFARLWPKVNSPKYRKDAVVDKLRENRTLFGRGLSLNQIVYKGEEISLEMLTLKKPEGPLSWNDRSEVIGRKALRDLYPEEHLKLEDLT